MITTLGNYRLIDSNSAAFINAIQRRLEFFTSFQSKVWGILATEQFYHVLATGMCACPAFGETESFALVRNQTSHFDCKPRLVAKGSSLCGMVHFNEPLSVPCSYS